MYEKRKMFAVESGENFKIITIIFFSLDLCNIYRINDCHGLANWIHIFKIFLICCGSDSTAWMHASFRCIMRFVYVIRFGIST